MKKRLTIGFLAMALLLGAARTPTGGRVASSMWEFGRHFQTEKSAQSISPIERLVLKLATTT